MPKKHKLSAASAVARSLVVVDYLQLLRLPRIAVALLRLAQLLRSAAKLKSQLAASRSVLVAVVAVCLLSSRNVWLAAVALNLSHAANQLHVADAEVLAAVAQTAAKARTLEKWKKRLVKLHQLQRPKLLPAATLLLPSFQLADMTDNKAETFRASWLFLFQLATDFRC